MRANNSGERAMRQRYTEEIWGTVVTIDVHQLDGEDPVNWDTVDIAFTECSTYMKKVDAALSTFRYDSEVTAYRNGWRKLHEFTWSIKSEAMLLDVIRACEWGKSITDGAFDPWAVGGGFDPSGFVKGWAAESMTQILGRFGLENFSINAGGDVVNRGYACVDTQGELVAWRIGVRHPDDPGTIAASFDVTNAAIATSGTYERGMHIVNPFVTKAVAGDSRFTVTADGPSRPTGNSHSYLAARSSTVIGPDAGVAEILSTALIVAGRNGATWFRELPDYSAFVVDPDGAQTTWRIGGEADLVPIR
ncbi:FAD:protein FMN transferase [Arcanobacterium ihumii]|uniref:FAD:protein FMN transferase n=1 Tax=Arcanobacterium ihumii TaxID=2138162 RepID=UPI000F53DBE1|nr:FAD:protein FMN transferase [Arcanobacterium ihumii]